MSRMERFFTDRMQNLLAQGVLQDNSFAPPWERLSSKLGTVAIPIEFLQNPTLACPVENDPLAAITSGVVEPSVEFRSYSPINHLSFFGSAVQDKMIVPVLSSLVQDFRDYRAMDMTHCDRWEHHILLGKAPTKGNIPVAQIVDIDLLKEGFQTHRMAAWFGQSVLNCCLSPEHLSDRMPLLDKLCEPTEHIQHESTASLKTSIHHLEQKVKADPYFQKHAKRDDHTSHTVDSASGASFLQGLAPSSGGAGNGASSFGKADGHCLGIAKLVSRVVKPALNVALGKASAPDSWWADEIEHWAKEFYGNYNATLQSTDDNDAVWTMLRQYEDRDGHNWETPAQ